VFGLRIVVPRARDQAGSLAGRLGALGAHVIGAPVISIEDPESWDALDAAIARLSDYDWVVFASANAVERFFARLHVAGVDARAMASVRLGAVGPATASAMARNGLHPDAVPARFAAAELAAALGEGAGRVLWPRVQGAPEEPAAELRAAGWTVHQVTAYRNVPVPPEELPYEACIGPSTADEARRAGLEVAVVAGNHTIEGLVDAIAQWVAR
jgi:uroporphyrinogen III methyltransferase/synthase